MQAAHEIKNLLTTILGYAELLQRRISSQDPLRPYVDEIARAAARAGVLSVELFVGKDGKPAAGKDGKPAAGEDGKPAAGENADVDPAAPAPR